MSYQIPPKYRKPTIIAVVILFIAILIPSCIYIWPAITSGKIFEDISSYGFVGTLLFLALWVLQMLLSIIPGEPFEIAAGTLYGPFWGIIMCLLGIFLGNLVIYYGVRLLGAKDIRDNPKFARFKFLTDPAKAFNCALVLFLIPGTPKDFLTYAGPFLPIKAPLFFVAAVFGRLPSIVTSVLAGDSIKNGDWVMTIIYCLSSLVLAGIGLLISKKVEAAMSRRHEELEQGKHPESIEKNPNN